MTTFKKEGLRVPKMKPPCTMEQGGCDHQPCAKIRLPFNRKRRLLEAAAPEMLNEIKQWIEQLEIGKRSGLTPEKDYSDWDTWVFRFKEVVARAEMGGSK